MFLQSLLYPYQYKYDCGYNSEMKNVDNGI